MNLMPAERNNSTRSGVRVHVVVHPDEVASREVVAMRKRGPFGVDTGYDGDARPASLIAAS